MKKSIKYLSLILAVFFLIIGCAAIAYAEGENGEQQADPGAGVETPVDNTPETPADPAPETPVVEPDPNPGTGTGTDIDTNTGNNGSGTVTDNSGGTGYDTSGGNDYSYDNSNQYDNNVDYSGNYANENNNNNYVYSDETAGSVSNSTNVLYNSSGISAAEAAPNEWSDIQLNEKTVTTGIADFSAIKTNTSTEDNGQMILYLGYILIALSVLGILYFIIATIAHRKAYNTAAARENVRSNYGGAHSQAARMNERDRAAQRSSQRSISRYNDEIKAYNRRVSSKADTGEVYVPRRAK